MLTIKKQGNKNIGYYLLQNKVIIILVVIAALAAIITQGKFFNAGNLSSVARQIAVVSILGIGFTLIMASGEVDLSVGQLLNVVAILYGILSLNFPIGIAIALSLAIGTFIGFTNGFITHMFKLPPFILTLASALVFKGFAWILCDGKSISGLPEEVKFAGQGVLFGFFPVSVAIMIVLLIAISVTVYRTQYGRYVIATGGNAEAARVSGINTLGIRISVYAIMGFCCAVGAIVLTGRVSTALPNTADGMEMDAIAAVVIGGTPMIGGKAKVVGTVLGCIIIGIISNTLNLMNVSSFWQSIAKGLIIIFAIMLDAQTESFLSRRRIKA